MPSITVARLRKNCFIAAFRTPTNNRRVPCGNRLTAGNSTLILSICFGIQLTSAKCCAYITPMLSLSLISSWVSYSLSWKHSSCLHHLHTLRFDVQLSFTSCSTVACGGGTFRTFLSSSEVLEISFPFLLSTANASKCTFNRISVHLGVCEMHYGLLLWLESPLNNSVQS